MRLFLWLCHAIIRKEQTLNFFGMTVGVVLGWVLVIVLAIVMFVGYMAIVRFIRKYATGMMAGFLIILFSLALIIGPAFYLFQGSSGIPMTVLAATAIFMGCVSFAIGAFELTSFTDF